MAINENWTEEDEAEEQAAEAAWQKMIDDCTDPETGCPCLSRMWADDES